MDLDQAWAATWCEAVYSDSLFGLVMSIPTFKSPQPPKAHFGSKKIGARRALSSSTRDGAGGRPKEKYISQAVSASKLSLEDKWRLEREKNQKKPIKRD